MDKIASITALITAIAAACTGVVGLIKLIRRPGPSGNVPSGSAGAVPVRPIPPTQLWSGSARPGTPPLPAPNPTAGSWYQQIPKPAGNHWSATETLESPVPVQPTSTSGPPNRWWHGAQTSERIRTSSRLSP